MFRPALIVHGGAGGAHPDLTAARRAGCTAALDVGWQVLRQGGPALDAVCAAVAAMEDDPAFNAGIGSCLTSAGTVEMDAAVMSGEALRAGAAAVVCTVRNPVHLARALLEDGRHVLLAGVATDAFAHTHGIETCEPAALVTAEQRRRWQQHTADTAGGTVGAAAVDRAGHVAAATSTGGIAGKLPGRVGDSAIIGAGTYADDRLGAASATGHGEAIMRVALTKSAVESLHDGRDPAAAAQVSIRDLEQRLGGTAGLIVVDPFGRVGHAYNTAHMTVGYMRADMPAYVVQA